MPVLIFLVWLILNGRVTLEILCFGVGISAALTILLRISAGYSLRRELRLWRGFFLAWIFLFRLVGHMFTSAFAVSRFILTGKQPRPVLQTSPSPVGKELARMMLANAITLTPGTITVLSREDRLTVHCLDESLSGRMDDGPFVQLLRRLEDKT